MFFTPIGSKSEIAVAVPADEIRTRMSGIVVQIEKGGAVNSSAIRFEWKVSWVFYAPPTIIEGHYVFWSVCPSVRSSIRPSAASG